MNSGSSNNHNSVTQRPFSQQSPTTSNYNYDNRRTTATTKSSTYRPNRDITTRKSTYFQGDLPFFNNDETSVSCKFANNSPNPNTLVISV